VKQLNIVILLSVLVFGQNSFGQNYSYKKKFGTQKNAMYFYWGYNRAAFTRSDIHFVGEDYDFTIIKAAAKDRPASEFKTYVTPSTLTVPQFNVRVGWYYKHRWDWSIGYDHMKYVMRDWQQVYINGYIDPNSNSELNGEFTNEDGKLFIDPDFIHYENTNGLNYISVQLNNTAPMYKTNDRKFAVQRRVGGGIGPVITQTDFVWDSEQYHSGMKLGGWGISAHMGVRFDFFNRFFIENTFSGGFIHLPRNATIVRGNTRDNDYANHKFVYGQWQITAGVLWYLRNKNGCGTCPDWH
jgi:hypothetical protein